MTERGQELETYLRDGTCKVAWTCRRPAGDTVVMLRRRSHEGGACSSVWLSLRAPRDLELLRRLVEGEELMAPTTVDSEAVVIPTARRFPRLALLRGLLM